MPSAPVVLHVSPHPDDECVGAPATLMALADAGWRVVNLACGLGRPAQHAVRRAELVEACSRAGFALDVVEPPAALSHDDDLAATQRRLRREIAARIERLRPRLVVSPSPHDRHHGHETVARAVRGALESATTRTPRWWMWGLWGELAFPTLVSGFDEARLREVQHALAAHASEVARLDLPRIVHARAELAAATGPERVFGTGFEGDAEAGAAEVDYAELLCEVAPVGDTWRLGAPRGLDPLEPLASARGRDVGWWLRQRTVTQRAGD